MTTALAPTNPGEALAAILSDADRMRDIDVEKMERLFALSREFAKDVARREFAEAFKPATGAPAARPEVVEERPDR